MPKRKTDANTNAPGGASPAFATLKVAELKARLAVLGEPTDGLKADLVARLMKTSASVADPKPVARQLMTMLTRATLLRSLLTRKALIWMIAARD